MDPSSASYGTLKVGIPSFTAGPLVHIGYALSEKAFLMALM